MTRDERDSSRPDERACAAVNPATLVGAAGFTLGLIAVVAALATLAFRHERDALRAERGWTAVPADTARTADSQRERLGQYAVLDRKAGVVAIPIERAMRLVVEESASAPGGTPR